MKFCDEWIAHDDPVIEVCVTVALGLFVGVLLIPVVVVLVVLLGAVA